MAVVSKVPTEVLTEIFYLLCKEPIFLSELNNSCCKEGFPWAVGLVCRQWRTAFLSYPPIWASLKLSDSYYDSSRIANPETRSESYSREMNRRLALYLERSGGHPLRLEVFLWSDHNKAFTIMALEMLSACSHRWRTAEFDLTCIGNWSLDSILPCKGNLPILEWLDIRVPELRKRVFDAFEVAPRLRHASIAPWAKYYGWILPWTQLTELILVLDGDFVIENDEVPNLLSMLRSIQELHLRFHHDELDFEGGFYQFPPTPLNHLHVLEVPHPAILSWFEAPSLYHLLFADYQQEYEEPLDVHGQVSSLIQRSGCKIRKLSFESGRTFHVGTLKDVEELVIDYTHSDWIRSPIDISSLPNLRLLTIVCRVDDGFNETMMTLITALKSARVPTRIKRSSHTPVSLLERVMVELHYDNEPPQIPKTLLKIAEKWPVVVFRTQRS